MTKITLQFDTKDTDILDDSVSISMNLLDSTNEVSIVSAQRNAISCKKSNQFICIETSKNPASELMVNFDSSLSTVSAKIVNEQLIIHWFGVAHSSKSVIEVFIEEQSQ